MRVAYTPFMEPACTVVNAGDLGVEIPGLKTWSCLCTGMAALTGSLPTLCRGCHGQHSACLLLCSVLSWALLEFQKQIEFISVLPGGASAAFHQLPPGEHRGLTPARTPTLALTSQETEAWLS